MAGNVLELKDDNFDQEVLQSKVPVLVDFWAAWCAPCRMIAPAVEELAGQYAERAKVAKLNVDQAQAIAQRYNVMSIPMLLMFKNGQVVQQTVGAVPKPQIEAMIKKAL